MFNLFNLFDMVIDLGKEAKLPEEEQKAFVNAIKSSGEGVVMTVNAAALPKITGCTYPKAVNWDDYSDVTDGMIRVHVEMGWWGSDACSLRVRYIDTDADEDMVPYELMSEGSLQGYRVDSTTLGVGSNNLPLFILSSSFFGRDPRKLKFKSDSGSSFRLNDMAYVAGPIAVFGRVSSGGKPIFAFDPLTCTRKVVMIEAEGSFADEDMIKSIDPCERYRMITQWSSKSVDFVYSRTLKSYIHRNNAVAVIIGLSVDDEGDGVIDVDFLDRKSNARTMEVFHRMNDEWSRTKILKSIANFWDGRQWTSTNTPIIKNGVFSFDVSSSQIVYRFDYHQASRLDAEPFRSGFSIGFEVEKEDGIALRKVCAEELFRSTRWAKERDGSLDGDTGYELVSPAYDLMSSKIDEDIASSPELTELINANYSRSCGGHIHLGSGWSGDTFFDKLSPWVPLIYSLYVGRIGANYCKVKKNGAIKESSDKYQAIRIFDDRVEFRIISAVNNVDTLIWRRDLMRIIVSNLDYTPMKIVGELLDDKSSLYAHLRKQYTPSQIAVKAKLYAYFASELLDDAHAVKQHIMNAVDHFSNAQLRHLKSHSFNVNKPE